MLRRWAQCLSVAAPLKPSSLALQVLEALNSCSFAAALPGSESGMGAPVGAFRGQMGCMYLFEDTLSPGRGREA